MYQMVRPLPILPQVSPTPDTGADLSSLKPHNLCSAEGPLWERGPDLY